MQRRADELGRILAREEVFGPVASVIEVDDFDHALAVVNDTPYGLAAGIITTSLAAATAFRRRARVGMVMVNLATAGVDFHVPFGGRGASSFGPREQVSRPGSSSPRPRRPTSPPVPSAEGVEAPSRGAGGVARTGIPWSLPG